MAEYKTPTYYCSKCGAELHYQGDYGAPGVGQSWKCDNGHYWSKLGKTFYDPSDGAHILDESDVI